MYPKIAKWCPQIDEEYILNIIIQFLSCSLDFVYTDLVMWHLLRYIYYGPMAQMKRFRKNTFASQRFLSWNKQTKMLPKDQEC